MDWGLLRCSWRDTSGKRLLRPKTLFPTWFYYYAAISNFILRFLWVLPLIKTLPEWMNSMQLVLLILCLGEGFRRTQWSLIRLENE